MDTRNSVLQGLKCYVYFGMKMYLWIEEKGNFHKTRVQGMPPKRRPQQNSNHHWRQQDYLPQGCWNPHRFPKTCQAYHKQCPLPSWCKFPLFEVKTIYFVTPMDRSEYVKIKIDDIPA